jgi:putative hemolysin
MESIHTSYAPEFQKTTDYPFSLDDVPSFEIGEGRYVARFARTPEEIDAALRLRFKVFNLELNEGLASSYLTERDEDEFDLTCHHLLVIERASNSVVGTYRVRTLEMAKDSHGFYSSGEFKLEQLPAEMLAQSLEIGRACISREHRNTRTLFLLWKGLATYVTAMKKRYLFGCCSLMTTDCTEGKKALRLLEREGHFHERFRVEPREQFACQPDDYLSEDDGGEIELTRLFNTYLRIGAKVCGEPVVDREFKTIDFFVVFDVEAIDEKYYLMFFAEAGKLLQEYGFTVE